MYSKKKFKRQPFMFWCGDSCQQATAAPDTSDKNDEVPRAQPAADQKPERLSDWLTQSFQYSHQKARGFSPDNAAAFPSSPERDRRIVEVCLLSWLFVLKCHECNQTLITHNFVSQIYITGLYDIHEENILYKKDPFGPSTPDHLAVPIDVPIPI